MINLEYFSLSYLGVCFLIFFLTLCGLILYKKAAYKMEILALKNYRTLHTKPTPKGGGIVFSIVFILCIFFLWHLNYLSNSLLCVLGFGGLIATSLGFLDDKFDINAKKKLVVEIFLCGFAMYYLDGGPLQNISQIPSFVSTLLSLFFLVWVINAFNFMDGNDGMAASGAIFSCLVIVITMGILNTFTITTALLIFLSISVSAFLIFNWPPAKIFMGDSGSIFLGYIFAVLIMYTTMNNEVSFTTWVIVFAYFISDTSVTLISRLILKKKWNKPHRSHAYQNIARIANSHVKVTTLVVLYNFIWVFPLALWSIFDPTISLFATILSLTPSLFFSYKYGPFLSSN